MVLRTRELLVRQRTQAVNALRGHATEFGLVVPLGVLGVLLATLLRSYSNDVYFQVGLITIIGLAAKDAILIIEFAKDLQSEGMGLVEATLEAVHLRFRPIIMTSLAFGLGVLPLVWPSRALLGAMLAECSTDGELAESAKSLSAARSAVLVIASDLPPGVRGEWLGRPDITALLEG